MGLRFFVYSAVAAGFSIAISSIGCGLWKVWPAIPRLPEKLPLP
jgi:hypothetical protein